MIANTQAPSGELPGDPDAAIRQLYSHYAKALHGYVEQFCPDLASADDIVQETFIRAWRQPPGNLQRTPARSSPRTQAATHRGGAESVSTGPEPAGRQEP